MWLDWVDQGKETGWIAENNGLIPTTHTTVRSYIDKHREEANRLRGKVDASPKPPPAPPNLEPDLEEVISHLARAIVGAAAIKSIQMDVDANRTNKGLSLRLEIRFKK